MRIAIVRRVCSLKKAGAERYCVNLFRHLQQLGQQVTIVGEEIDPELRGEVDFIPVKVNRLTTWTRNTSFAKNCGVILRDQQFEVAHGLSRVSGLDTFRLTDPLQAHWIETWYQQPFVRWLQKRNPRHAAVLELERQLYSSTGPRRIIVQSTLDAELLQRYYHVDPARLRLIRNGVDAKVFHTGLRAASSAVRAELGFRDADAVLVFASMDFRRKGLRSLFESLQQLRTGNAVRAPKLLVLGNGDIPGYQRLAQRMGIAEQVRFLGRQGNIGRFYAAADLFVLPTIYEPFPNVNLEAMACGTPVLTTASAGGRDLIRDGENGYLIPDATCSELMADRIEHHLCLPTSQRAEMSRHCVESARPLTPIENARQTLAVFEEVRRGQRRAA